MTPYRVTFTGREWFQLPSGHALPISVMTPRQLLIVANGLSARSPTRAALLRLQWRKRLLQ